MKVLKRSQVTSVVTKRMVFHTIDYVGKKYIRIAEIRVEIPYMDCKVIETPIKVTWQRYINDNTVETLSKKVVSLLALEQRFNLLDINELNGNG
jgi:hypothetical protein